MTSLSIQALAIAAVFVVFYLVLVRPQRLRLQRHREMLTGLRPGQQIATIGGLVGTIARIDNVDRLTLTIADGITVTILRSAVDTLIEPASTPSLATPRLDEQRAVA